MKYEFYELDLSFSLPVDSQPDGPKNESDCLRGLHPGGVCRPHRVSGRDPEALEEGPGTGGELTFMQSDLQLIRRILLWLQRGLNHKPSGSQACTVATRLQAAPVRGEAISGAGCEGRGCLMSRM